MAERPFRKHQLKTGMLVKNRKGLIGIVLKGTTQGDIIGGNGAPNNTWFPLSSLKYDLCYMVGPSRKKPFPEADIMEVYDNGPNCNAASFETKGRTLIWKREE